MEFDSETFRLHLPTYLMHGHSELILELNRFSQSKPVNYFMIDRKCRLLQGDCWRGFDLIRYDTARKKRVLGIILSNTCDIAPENKRDLSRRITFAPLIKLEKYRKILQRNGHAPQQIESKLDAVRSQKVTTMFYVPSGGNLIGNHIALLDYLYSVPASAFERNSRRRRIFTLSMVGFYIFLFKLSVHFCRSQEGDLRMEQT